MKVSQYNIFFDHKDKKFAFNSMTCALAEVNDRFFKLSDAIKNNKFDIKDLNKEDLNILENMKRGGFITDDCFNETEFMNLKVIKGNLKQTI